MKKLIILLFAMAISLPSFAGLKEKDVVGKWTYKVETMEGTMAGTVVFELKDGKLTGEVSTDNSEVFPLTKVEIRDDNVLYFELVPEYEAFMITVTMEKKTFAGTVVFPGGEAPITGEKVE